MKKATSKSIPGINYPQTAFIAYILIVRKQNFRFFLPFNEVFVDLGLVKAYSQKFIAQSVDENTFIPPAPVVFPINLVEKITLKPQYWDEPNSELSRTERINNFLKPLENHRFQKLLVTPFKNAHGTILTAAYCFNLTAGETEISFFMSTTYLSMDEKEKFAAVYHFADPFRFELSSGKKVIIQETEAKIVH